LMNSLLQEREHRLCSKKYMLNDYLHSHVPGHLIAAPSEKSSKNYQGYFVYSEDADDIKAHPFFRGTEWNKIHTMKPPFVPKVKSWEDTKYFEEDEPVSDIDDASSFASGHADAKDHAVLVPATPLTVSPSTFENAVVAAGTLGSDPSGFQAFNGKTVNEIIAEQNRKLKEAEEAREKEQAQTKRKEKDKKRPRDKMLRDKVVGRQVLDLRKKGAFLGYTWRRPKGLEALIGENERME
jgi:hypothetical protein